MANSNRFHDSNELEIKYLNDTIHNKNTGLSTNTWVNAFIHLINDLCTGQGQQMKLAVKTLDPWLFPHADPKWVIA